MAVKNKPKNEPESKKATSEQLAKLSFLQAQVESLDSSEREEKMEAAKVKALSMDEMDRDEVNIRIAELERELGAKLDRLV